MKRVSKWVFVVLTVAILALLVTSIFGIHGTYGDYDMTYIKGVNDIRWGIDIQGGVEATYCPADGVDATNEQMDSAKAVIELRMINDNITDYELYVDYDNDKIIVRFPWAEDETTFNPEEAIKELSATADLTFRGGNEYTDTKMNSEGDIVYSTPKGETESNLLLSGSDIASAQAVVTSDQSTNQQEYAVELNFTDEGTQKFADATQKYMGETISIWMDDEMISAPTVNAVITDGVAMITGNFTSQEATDLANKINAGALPFKLDVVNYGTISPTLGAQALEAMGIAILLAMILVCAFMLITYKIPGLVASICLLGHLAISIAAISGYFGFMASFTMTLPGIAGLILSVGMGADANVIMAERTREELRAGKTLDGAIKGGSKNSFSAIFDGNITVMIVAIILMLVFGPSNILSVLFGPSTTGTIYSFGYTLLVGVIANFIMSVGTARLMLSSLSGYKHLRNRRFYGGEEK